MKNIFKKIVAIAEVIGQARAASALTRSGKYQEAQVLMAGAAWVKKNAAKKSCCAAS